MGKTDLIKPIIDDAVRGILDLLGSGRADEITDAMLDLGDPVMNARLNEALWRNYDLPMDYASRTERATAMGFDPKVDLYRGDDTDHAYFEALGLDGTYTSTDARVADDYAGKDGVIAALLGNRKNFATSDEFRLFDADGFDQAIWDAKDAGRHGIVFRDVVDNDAFSRHGKVSADTNVFFDPANIRSRFARFDPRLAHLKNLNAALAGGAGVTGLLSMTPEEARAAEIEAYLQGLR